MSPNFSKSRTKPPNITNYQKVMLSLSIKEKILVRTIDGMRLLQFFFSRDEVVQSRKGPQLSALCLS